ncbi:glycosyltransferase [Sinomonas atrocyanea]|uniref:glycosyltransferase n=1 Tax=Sinomonas atrocyanea TaxID=37927 RepID=UPI002787F2E2|nr:glycosyltransferase [Sinomonas atrocyanea]MDQ0259104.1 cellulose synthase (UDP-forming) [Sinomonas atrocyanea]MDR6622636.1 cellulose synthase (UDP-forming) [Sinomonas atrocyanea]
MRLFWLRLVAALAVLTGINYVAWRWAASLNWDAWWIAVPLVIAETYSLIDVSLFALTAWRLRGRGEPTAAPEGLTVDVLITTYNEPNDLVLETARAARDIRYPHRTWILDDGSREDLREEAARIGVGYLTRGAEWAGKPRHAKAGNLNNALQLTEGEFFLVLDADQVPASEILDRTLGYFSDRRVALVQTPQWFWNVPDDDPLGSQAPLFYGPIQQGKDAWNAAFFCGSNAILRREALMQLGLAGYVRDTEQRVRRALEAGASAIRRARRRPEAADPGISGLLDTVGASLGRGRRALAEGGSIAEITFTVQAEVDDAVRTLVSANVRGVSEDLSQIASLVPEDQDGGLPAGPWFDEAVAALSTRELSPLAALESVRAVLDEVTVERAHEAQPVMPLSTISVTEDMSTSMRLHATGWRSVYHHEVLAAGLAPEDLKSMLTQRLRWAQGTIQVMLRESPLTLKGLRLPQRLMYFATMWSYLSGFAAIAYFAAPVIFLTFGILPVHSLSPDFFARFVPFMVLNQSLFLLAARGAKTWRGQQYSLALFPTWIKACTTAAANVWFGRPLGFAVTPKARQDGGDALLLLRPQAVVAALLVLSAVIGTVRLVLGIGEPLGTLVNVIWTAYDLLALSVLVKAARYRGFPSERSRT